MINRIATSFFFLFLCFQALAQLTLKITAVPANTPSNDAIYVAGSFNNWDPANNSYKLTKTNGIYSITINPPAGAIEYKFTRGSWASVEGNAQGSFLPNRTLSYTGNATVLTLNVQSWEDLGGSANHTAAPNAIIMNDNFYIPQLNRYRRIWLYLPPDYQSTQKHYPVMYMQDGQNLFDSYYSFSGEWEVDESLNDLFDNGDDGIIIVGIDNGGTHRIDEYSPWVNANYGGGEGELYTDFIVNTLKPYIDSNYRTLSDRNNTGIMGSSVGGLISMYAAIAHQDVFSKAGIFSPSFWFSDSCYLQVQNTGKLQDMKFYLLAGGNEEPDDDVITKLNLMKNKLLSVGFTAPEIQYVIKEYGQHNESFWRNEFPDAYQWLFGDLTIHTTLPVQANVSIFPNPTDSVLNISMDLRGLKAEIYAGDGKKVLEKTITNIQSLNVAGLPTGFYTIRLIDDAGKLLYSNKFIRK